MLNVRTFDRVSELYATFRIEEIVAGIHVDGLLARGVAHGGRQGSARSTHKSRKQVWNVLNID